MSINWLTELPIKSLSPEGTENVFDSMERQRGKYLTPSQERFEEEIFRHSCLFVGRSGVSLKFILSTPRNKHRCAHTRRKELNMTDGTTDRLINQYSDWQINSQTDINTDSFISIIHAWWNHPKILIGHSNSLFTHSPCSLISQTVPTHILPILWLVSLNGLIHNHGEIQWKITSPSDVRDRSDRKV